MLLHYIHNFSLKEFYLYLPKKNIKKHAFLYRPDLTTPLIFKAAIHNSFFTSNVVHKHKSQRIP